MSAVNEKNSTEEQTYELQQRQPRSSWTDTFKFTLLAKAPLEGAPLVFGGHRQAEEPEPKLSLRGVLLKFATFIGPGLIVAIPFNDPDNYLEEVQDGQEFQYKQLCTILVAVMIATYIQVCISEILVCTY
jgi:hypothetical protein